MTNLPSLIKRSRRAVPALTLLVIALLLVGLPHFNALFFAHKRYEQCSDLAAKDPAASLLLARSWRLAQPESPLAKHCEAIALFATHDYTHAGDAFTGLAKNASPTNPALATHLFIEGGEAYKAAAQYDLAKESAATALLLAPGDKGAKDLLTEIAKENTPATLSPSSGQAKP